MDTISEKLVNVCGDKGKTNDVFVYGDLIGKHHILYVGGDIQNYEENMEDYGNASFVQWSTEKTATILHSKFPASLIFVVKPKEMELRTFAVYSNFLDIDATGCLLYSSGLGAIQHLAMVHRTAWQKIIEKFYPKTQSDICFHDRNNKLNESNEGQHNLGNQEGIHDETGSKSLTTFESIPISIIGFSKGCIVLNQLVFELEDSLDVEARSFLQRIKELYWLDGGHINGESGDPRKHAWLTEPMKVRALVTLGCGIHIHVSHYQVSDLLRPWVGKQYQRFCELLSECGATFEQKMHFDEQTGSLENHFKVLEAF